MQDTAIIVDGDLHIDELFIYNWNKFYIKGDVYCDVFSGSDDGLLECKNLFVKKYADLGSVNDLETIDVRNIIKAPIVVPGDADNFDIDAEFNLDDYDEFEAEFGMDLDEVIERIEVNFEEVYKQLKDIRNKS